MINNPFLGVLLGASAIVLSNDVPTPIKAAATAASWLFGDRIQICDATADDIQIQVGIEAVHVAGGLLLLVGNLFNLASRVDHRSGVYVRGMGTGVTTVRGVTAGMFMWSNDVDIPLLNAGLDGLTFDGYSGTVANITPIVLNSPIACTFPSLEIKDCVNACALKIQVRTTGDGNSYDNDFGTLRISNTYVGIWMTGDSATELVTLCHFDAVYIRDIVAIGFYYEKWADNNIAQFSYLGLSVNNAIGVKYNTDGVDRGVYANNFGYLGVDSFGITGAVGVQLFRCKQIRIEQFFHSPERFNGTLVQDNNAESYYITNLQRDIAQNDLETLGKAARGSSVAQTVVKLHTSDLFDAGALVDQANIWLQPANSILEGVAIVLDTQFAAVGMTDLDVTVGDAGNNAGILNAAMNLTTDAVDTEYVTKGAYWNTAIGPFYYVAAATQWIAYATAVGANLNTTTAGQVTFYFRYRQL